MDSKTYQELALRTMADQMAILTRLNNPNIIGPQLLCMERMQLINGVIGLADEAGEMCAAAKSHIEYGKPLDITNIKEEVGDCFWRLRQICDAVGLTFEECMQANIDKLKKRYPDKYSDHLAQEENRNRAAEREAMTPPEIAFQEHNVTHSLCPHNQIDMGGQEVINGTEVGTCLDCGKKVSIQQFVGRHGKLPDNWDKDPYSQTGAGWAEPTEASEENLPPIVRVSVDNGSARIDSPKPFDGVKPVRVHIEGVKELAKQADSGNQEAEDQLRHLAIGSGITVNKLDECMDWKEVAQLIINPPKKKPKIKEGPFHLARRIADTYIEGQNLTKALTEIDRAEGIYKETKDADSRATG